MHALGEYLTQQMKERGWSQSDLARHAGLTRQSVSNLLDPDKTELGGHLTRRTFAGLSDALQVPAEDLVVKAAEAMGVLPSPQPAKAPAQTMIALVRILRDDHLSATELADYLRLYHQLADVVAEALIAETRPNT